MTRHFPILTELYPRYFSRGLCGYESANPKEFVNPQQYQPSQVMCAGCQNYDKVNTTTWAELVQESQ